MRVVPLPIVREILFGAPTIAELVEVHARGGDEPDLRFALFDQKLVWNGEAYLPAGFQTPLKTRQSMADSLGELQIMLPDVDRAIASLLELTDAAGTPVVVRRVLLNHLDTDHSVVMYYGRIKAPVTLEGTTAVITLVPFSEDPEGLTSLPRRPYSFNCTVPYGGPECGVTRLQYAGSAGEGCNELVIRDPALTAEEIDLIATTLTPSGEPSAVPSSVVFLTGDNEGQGRPVALVSPGVIEMRKPFYAAPAEGDLYILRRECVKTKGACRGFGNIDRFNGHSNSPRQPRNLMRDLVQ